MPNAGTVLVTGATGRHGGTSAHVVSSLLQAGRPVRVLARTESDRTQALSALGAEIVFGDFNDRRSLLAALEGIDTATFTYPVAAGIVPAAATFAAAAREAGRPIRVVVMSMGVAHPDSPTHLGRAQWLAEEVLSWAGLDLCILRIAALFYENITSVHAPSIQATSGFANSFGTANVPWISGLDAARLVVAAVTRPDLFAGRAIHYPPAAELLSHEQVATILTEELGRPIRFTPVTREEWTAELLELSQRENESVINADMARHIPAIGVSMASARALVRAPDPAELQRLTGAPPLPLRQFLAEHRSVFGQ